MKVLITGANGFVGKALFNFLKDKKYDIKGTLRSDSAKDLIDRGCCVVGDLNKDTDWSQALKDIDVVIHTAARVHAMNLKVLDKDAYFRIPNVEGTINLAQQALKYGVKRFIFLSTIKVCGEETNLDQGFQADDMPNPKEPYANSKLEAEKALFSLAKDTSMEVVIIRLPIVYGPNVKGNFKQIIYWIKRGLPLPFGNVVNKRSFIGVNNLVHLIDVCTHHPNAGNQIFMASDGYDLSTLETFELIGSILGKKPKIIYVPQKLIIWLGNFLRQQKKIDRLTRSLRVNIDKTCSVLEWHPPFSVKESMENAFKEKMK
ncbi:MAG: NAD-dependent epimerase/dehydratase family protein [Pseudomonadota bacterium]|nr:NAD-dependent epimerase/dehydratase family protein [Pseudomonadota bacterium]